jgi:hypothetical protein
MAAKMRDLSRVFAVSAMTREQYVRRSKENALALLRDGRMGEAVASMMMDMRKQPDCGVPHEVHAIGICAADAGDVALARVYIDGFN